MKNRDALLTLIAALDVLWRDYCSHDEDCPAMLTDDREPCTCGFGDAMTAIHEARKARIAVGDGTPGPAPGAAPTLREAASAVVATFDAYIASLAESPGSLRYYVDFSHALAALRAELARAGTERRPDHWWRQAVIDVVRQHGEDGLGWLIEVCARMDQLNREAADAERPPQETTDG